MRESVPNRRSRVWVFAAFSALVAAFPAPSVARAQEGGARARADGPAASRSDLESLQEFYLAAAASPAYSPALRAEARRRGDEIQTRLQRGDFREGDLILIRVEDEPQLTDTFPVLSGRELYLPLVGGVQLQGVLRDELEDRLRARVSTMIRDPVVHAIPLVQVGVFGEVAGPGFYDVSASARLTDLVMAAGGPADAAELDKLEVRRAGEPVLTGEEAQVAMRQGATLTELGIRSGDHIIVPKGASRIMELARGALYALPGLVLAWSQLR